MSETSCKPPVSMIGRVSTILGTFTPERPVMTGGEIARLTHLSRATVARILKELVTQDLVERVDDGYCIGIRCFELGQLAQRPRDIRRLARASMLDLRQATGLTVQLVVLEGKEVVYVEILQGSRPDLAIPSRVGGRLPCYATAGGKAVLAHSSASLQESVLNGQLIQCGPQTITDPAMLRAELLRIQHSKIAYELNESSEGIACVASPILRSDGTPLAAISLTSHAGTVDMRSIGPAVLAATLGLSRVVGSASRSLRI